MAQQYRLDLSYCGSSFQGWQSQPSGQTIQDEIEKALTTFLRHPVRITGASRTDSGVHAWQQVATFATDVDFEPSRWLRSLQGLLPADIGPLNVTPVPEDFHPITSAKSKVYLYQLWCSQVRHPFARQVMWHVPEQLDDERIRESLAAFIGEHDFTSFCAIDSTAKTRVRKIIEVEVVRQGAAVQLWLHGTGFLKQMVRAIAGTVVEAGLGRRPAGLDAMAALLAAQDREQAGKTAPAHGLTLAAINYEDDLSLATIREQPLLGGFVADFDLSP